MRALVTGVSGFAGSWLSALLTKKGYNVVGWSRRPPAFGAPTMVHRSVDVRDALQCQRSMKEASPDVVFHLAANANPRSCESDPDDAIRTNVEGTVNVFSAMPNGAVGVHVSTCHVYGSGHTDSIDESAATQASGVYARTKLAAEEWIVQSSLPIIRARAFHHTGPNQGPDFAVADWCSRVRMGKESIRVGNLDAIRDYSDVRDIVAGYLLLAECGNPGEVYNLCSGIGRSMHEILATVIGTRPIQVVVDDSRLRPLETQILVGNPGKAMAAGWRPHFTLADTLREMSGA